MADAPSAAELERIQHDFEPLLPDRATIRRATVVEDWGGETETFTDVALNVPCSIEPLGVGSESVIAGQLAAVQTVAITFPAGTDIRTEDDVVVTSKGNRLFHVGAVLYPETWEVARRVVASEGGS